MNVFLIEIRKLALIRLFILILAIKLIIAIGFNFLSQKLYNQPINKGKHNFESLTEEFIIVVLVAPIVETILFQFLPFKMIPKVRYKKYLYIVVSAIFFAFFHQYSMLYALNAFVSGILFSYSYWLSSENKPFLFVTALHLSYNLFAFLLNNYF